VCVHMHANMCVCVLGGGGGGKGKLDTTNFSIFCQKNDAPFFYFITI
jgi:hypothetical protein